MPPAGAQLDVVVVVVVAPSLVEPPGFPRTFIQKEAVVRKGLIVEDKVQSLPPRWLLSDIVPVYCYAVGVWFLFQETR